MSQSEETRPIGRQTTRVAIELCAGGIDDVVIGASAGVDRIELNCGMPVGGLTPTLGLLENARPEFSGPLITMLRPREGGFCYSAAEYRVMLRDAERLLGSGADGLAFGFLNEDGTVDAKRCSEMRGLFPQSTLVFHRAFDVVPDASIALEQLIDCGLDRILTSGGRATANEGAAELCQRRIQAAGRIEILPGGGIRPENAVRLIGETGCRQLHTSVRAVGRDLSTRSNPALSFGAGQGELDNGSFGTASVQRLMEFVAIVRSVDLPESQ